MNYFDTSIEVADDCPTKKAQVPLARGGKKTKAVVEHEILVKHSYVAITQTDIRRKEAPRQPGLLCDRSQVRRHKDQKASNVRPGARS